MLQRFHCGRRREARLGTQYIQAGRRTASMSHDSMIGTHARTHERGINHQSTGPAPPDLAGTAVHGVRSRPCTGPLHRRSKCHVALLEIGSPVACRPARSRRHRRPAFWPLDGREDLRLWARSNSAAHCVSHSGATAGERERDRESHSARQRAVRLY